MRRLLQAAGLLLIVTAGLVVVRAGPARAATTCTNNAAFADPRAQAAVDAVAAKDSDVADGETALLQAAQTQGTLDTSGYRNERVTVVFQNGYVWQCDSGTFLDAAGSAATAREATAAAREETAPGALVFPGPHSPAPAAVGGSASSVSEGSGPSSVTPATPRSASTTPSPRTYAAGPTKSSPSLWTPILIVLALLIAGMCGIVALLRRTPPD
jgi:hypothetical protein